MHSEGSAVGFVHTVLGNIANRKTSLLQCPVWACPSESVRPDLSTPFSRTLLKNKYPIPKDSSRVLFINNAGQ